MENYAVQTKIGEGAYSIVYKAVKKGTSDVVAIKKCKDPYKNRKRMEHNVLREINVLKRLSPHPNIIDLRRAFVEEGVYFLEFDYVPMDLKDFIRKEEKTTSPLVKSILIQIVRGMEHCHSNSVIHRDLKPDNILIYPETNFVKIADMGLSRAIDDDDHDDDVLPTRRPLTAKVVTLHYRAPEILMGATRYSYSSDMWSVGCVFGEMVKGRILFPGICEIDQLFRIFKMLKTPTEDIWKGCARLKNWSPDFPAWNKSKLEYEVPELDKCAFDLLQKMLVYDPDERITAKNALNHPYFHDTL